MPIKDYNTDPDLNTTISGINIAEGCAPSGINNAIRQLMADVRAEKDERDAAQEERDAAQEERDAAQDEEVANLDTALRELIADVGGDAEAAKNSVPTGTVIAFTNISAPPGGYLSCNGAAVSRTTYADLFAVIGTTFGAGDGSTTFNLPDLRDRYIKGQSSEALGTYWAPGLPDHAHSFSSAYSLTQYIGGQGSTADYVRPVAGWVSTTVTYASGWNNIYGASTTVQPPALTMRYYIKY